jgi:opacity protein-like surface antigen
VASVGEVDATGYFNSDFSGGVDDSGSWYDIDTTGSSFDVDFDNQINIGSGYYDGLNPNMTDLLDQVFNGGKAGFLGRAEIGADFENNGVLFGLNGSFGLMKLKQKVSVYHESEYLVDWDDDTSGDASGSGSGSLSTELKYGNSFTVGARAGFLATPSTLLFAGGGFARQKVNLDLVYSGGFSGSFDSNELGEDPNGEDSGEFVGTYNVSSSESKWANGYYVGGGMEQMFGENTSLKVEYRFTDLGSISTSDDYYASGSDSGSDYDVSGGVGAEADLRTHAVTATLNFRF